MKMKTFKTLFFALCLFATSLFSTVGSFAAEDKNSYNNDELARISQEIVRELAVFRNEQFYIKNADELTVRSKNQEYMFSEKVLLNSIERSVALSDFEEDIDVSFQDVNTSFSVIS